MDLFVSPKALNPGPLNPMTNRIEELKQKIADGRRVTSEEAGSLFSLDPVELGRLGDTRRKLVFPKEQVGFIIDRIVNYTNICEAACDFCAFHSRAGRIDPYELSTDDILLKIETLVAAGGTQVMLQGGLHPEYTLDVYVDLVRAIKDRFPDICLHSFSPAELMHISGKAGMDVYDVVGILKNAGLDSVPGASDLLVDRIRAKVSPRKITTGDWCDVMNVLHRHGMKSSATMTYGMGETLDERIAHLEVIREVQDRTGIIRAFIPWSFSPAMTGMADILPASGIDYLKILAIARIFLDNVVYIQAGWLTEGQKIAQIALTMGANDMGGVLMEEMVVRSTGIEAKTDMNEMIRVIRNTGKTPVQRDSDYRVIKRF